MTKRVRLWLVAVAAVLIAGAAGAAVVRAAGSRSAIRASEAVALARELGDTQDRLNAALRDVNASRLDDARQELVVARDMLGHARRQLTALNRAGDVKTLMALINGVDEAQRLIVQLSK